MICNVPKRQQNMKESCNGSYPPTYQTTLQSLVISMTTDSRLRNDLQTRISLLENVGLMHLSWPHCKHPVCLLSGTSCSASSPCAPQCHTPQVNRCSRREQTTFSYLCASQTSHKRGVKKKKNPTIFLRNAGYPQQGVYGHDYSTQAKYHKSVLSIWYFRLKK